MSIYSQIDSNKRKTWLIMFLFVVFITTLGYVFGKATGYGLSLMGVFLIISGLISLVSYYFSDSMVVAVSHAVPVSKAADPELYHVVENLAMAAGIPAPKIYIINDTALNAFATGRDPEHGVVAITTGLRNKLEKTELEGVIAHELSHIGNFDTRLLAIVTILVGMVSLLADWFMRSLWFGDRDRGGKSEGLFLVIGLVLALISPIIATLIQLSISRKREYLADANGAYITRYPEGMAKALEIMRDDHKTGKFANNATASVFFINPFKGSDLGSKFSNLFNTHPPIEERIKLLREM